MEIVLNNRPETMVGDLLTVNELLAAKKFTFRMLVIKINGTLIKKEDYSIATIKNGDNVTVLHLISGG